MHLHFLTARRLRRMFIAGIDVRARRRVIAEAKQCERCREVLRRHYRFEGALAGVGAVASPVAVDRMASAILDAVSPVPKKKRFAYRRPLWAVAAVSALLFFSWLWWLQPLPSHRVDRFGLSLDSASELVSRGGIAGDADVGIRVFAVSEQPRRIDEPSTLSIHDMITFTYTRAVAGTGYLALFGLQEEGNMIWYYPDYGERESVRVKGARVDEPLKDGFDLFVHHREGPLLIVALFSEKPLLVADIEDAAHTMAAERPSVEAEAMYAWPMFGETVSVHSLLLEVEVRGE